MAKKLSKKYAAAAAKVDFDKKYALEEAVALLIETSTTKFDSSIELHVNLNVNVKHADQIVRGTTILPHGTGKKVRVAAFVEADKEAEAKKAGADLVGLETLIASIEKGKIDFDVAVAQPQVMKSLGKIARTLGTKGLMPNPKAGTVTPDIGKAIEEIKKGKVEYKTDKTGIIHSVLGKVSFGKAKLLENIKLLLELIVQARPVAVKGTYIISVSLSTTMGPGIAVDPSTVS
ncbi:50S ribosomal protein L1 [Candidatus Peregrinibacteria bacterium]|nr:MAG: 50S ribosomal protein L1 [Candidatus Peregrinibacteria bacterium]